MKIFFLLFILSIFIIGCNQKDGGNIDSNLTNISPTNQPIIEEKDFCSMPYIEYKKGDCCLDVNNNKICDNDEKAVIKETINNTNSTPKEVSDVDKVFLSLQNKGILVTEVSFWFNPSTGNICRTFLDAPTSDPDFEQIRISFIDMYKMFGNSPDEYCVIIDNAKNKNQYRPHETCYYCGKKLSVRDAYNVNNWDDIKGYCNTGLI